MIETTRRSTGDRVTLAWHEGKVIGKTTEPGVFWGTHYTLALDFDALVGAVTQRVSFGEFSRWTVGDWGYWLFVSKDGERWRMTAPKHYAEAPPVPSDAKDAP